MGTSASLQQGQAPVFCKLCTKETKISWKCHECDILMCNNCKERRHPNLKNAKFHKIVDIKDMGKATEKLDVSSFKCHTGQEYVMFCSSCDQLVCPECITILHIDHSLIEIEEARERKVFKLRTRLDVISEEEDKINQLKTIGNANYSKIKSQILLQKELLKKKIDEYSEKLIAKLNQNWDSLESSLKEAEKKVVLLKKRERDNFQQIEDIINFTEIEKIFEESKKLEESLQEILNLVFTSKPTFEPGEISESNFGKITDYQFQILKRYTTDISNIFHISQCADSLWISNEKLLQKIQPEINDLRVIFKSENDIRGMAVSSSNEIFLIPRKESTLKQMDVNTGKLSNTKYNIYPLYITAIYITEDCKVVVGGRNPQLVRQAVIIMTNDGKHTNTYEYDKSKRPLFTYPRSITCTKKGNICVADRLPSVDKGRIVILTEGGEILTIYRGIHEIDINVKPFEPTHVVTTPLDKIIVSDYNDALHILDDVGHAIAYIDTNEIGINHPFSIAFTSTGKVYVGCTKKHGNNANVKLFEVVICIDNLLQ